MDCCVGGTLRRQQNDEDSAMLNRLSTSRGCDFLSFQFISHWSVRCVVICAAGETQGMEKGKIYVEVELEASDEEAR
jgi:hypothetical protein